MKKTTLLILIIIAVLFSCTGKKGNPPVEDKNITAPVDDPVEDSTNQGTTEPGIKPVEKTTEEPVKPRSIISKDEETSDSKKITTPEPEEAIAQVVEKTPEPARTRRTLTTEELGEIIYMEGDVEISRDGDIIEADSVDIGTGIENFDIVKTGDLSLAEVEIRTKQSPETLVTVLENTSFVFELNEIENVSQSTFEVLTGTITLKVDKLLSNQTMTVASDTANMGVRGTLFTVATLPSGDFLVTCKEGKVECSDESGRKSLALPGKVVEKIAGGNIKEISVSTRDADAYREKWMEERVRYLKSNALGQIKKYAALYEKNIGEFNDAYSTMIGETGILNKWYSEDRQGKTGSTIEKMKEKKIIIKHLFKIRKKLVTLNRVYNRLLKLKKYHDQGIGKGEIRSGLSTTAFFTTILNEGLERKIARVMYITKLYAKRNDGSVPTEEFDDMDTDFGMDADFDF